MSLNDIGITLEIFGFLIALPTTRYIIMAFVAFCLVFSNKKSLLKLEENREPKSFKEHYEKEKKINSALFDVWEKVMAKWTPDTLNKTNYSKWVGVFGVILIVSGLILQYSFFV